MVVIAIQGTTVTIQMIKINVYTLLDLKEKPSTYRKSYGTYYWYNVAEYL